MTPFPPTPISPATQAAMAPASPTDEERLFEEKFGQMAHQVFSSQFPDLTESVITFKILDSDIENNSAIGAFILEQNGQFLYVPTILSDNQLKPFDLVYVKNKDIFLPLTPEWIEELSKGTLDTLGEGVKLPPTVATDVDIRNIVVPPTTGRYSYAHVVSPANRFAAEATEPLGRKLHKFAGSVGESTSEEFNPEVWATFNEQFQRVQGMTPGQAIDGSTMDVATLAKMYKQHARTWDLATQSAYAQGMDPSQMAQQQQQAATPGAASGGTPTAPMRGQAPMAQPGMTTTAAQKTAASPRQVEKALTEIAEKQPSTGGKLDNLLDLMRSGAAGGAAIGAVRSGLDTDDLSEVPGGMIRGAAGGAIGAPLGRAVGGAFGTTHLRKGILPMDEARTLGGLVGGATGGYLAAGARHTNYERLRHPFAQPGPQTATDPYGNLIVTASDHNQGIAKMLKHAQDKSHEHKLILPDVLKIASNNVKRGFAAFLDKHPRILKIAADIYGEETLINSLTPTQPKTAGVSHSGGQLVIADKKTPTNDFFSSFGEAAPTAFNGVLLKGYYYKDTRPNLNLAVQTQEYHDFHDTRESGVYLVYPKNKMPEAALVIIEPIDLLNDDRPTFPKDYETRVKHVRTTVPTDLTRHEFDDITGLSTTVDVAKDQPDVERSHILSRMFLFDKGRYGITEKLIGEQIAETALKDTSIFKTLMTNNPAPPKAGKGIFVYKRGVHYFGTKPVELSNVSTGTDGTITATIKSPEGWREKNLVIDSRSPIGRIVRPRDNNTVIVPARYRWLPLNDRVNEKDYISTGTDVTRILINALGSMGAKPIVAQKAGGNLFSVNGEKSADKTAALKELAQKHHIHASAAEALLKLASAETVSRAYVVTPSQYRTLRTKVAQLPAPMPPPAAAPPQQQDPNAGMGQLGAPPAMTAPPPAPSPIDQAFSETADQLQQQITSLQAQLDVLMTVQDRANQLSGEQVPVDPNAPVEPTQAAPPDMSGGNPGMSAPPDTSGMPPMDPSMAAYGAQATPPDMSGMPPMPVMRTEEPSSAEIANQINPAFLEQAGQFQDAGAFDAGAVGSLAQTPSLADISTQYAANLEDSVDDLGRTLLTLYMQETELKEQLGDDAFVTLEEQLRNTFKNLGKLTLNLSHNTAQLNNRAPA